MFARNRLKTSPFSTVPTFKYAGEGIEDEDTLNLIGAYIIDVSPRPRILNPLHQFNHAELGLLCNSRRNTYLVSSVSGITIPFQTSAVFRTIS